MEQQVITHFHESIEAKMHTGEQLAPLVALASQHIVEALLNERKILTCGNGISAAHAQIFTANLVNSFQHERPSLPALSLGTDIVSYPDNPHDLFAKQIRTLGHQGDILLLVSATGYATNLLQAISAAHDKGMQVIALTGKSGGDVAALLDTQDIELRAAIEAKHRIHEVHLLCLFSLCELIDQQLFGGF